jgi:hypothetical protein
MWVEICFGDVTALLYVYLSFFASLPTMKMWNCVVFIQMHMAWRKGKVRKLGTLDKVAIPTLYLWISLC